MEHFLPSDANPKDFARAAVKELGDFVVMPYSYEVKKEPGSGRNSAGKKGSPGKEKKKEPDLTTIWVLEKKVPGQHKIEQGISDNSYTEVKSGDLREGMEVITDAVTAKEKSQQSKGQNRGMRVRF